MIRLTDEKIAQVYYDVAQVRHEMNEALGLVWLSVYLAQRWNEMVRDN